MSSSAWTDFPAHLDIAVVRGPVPDLLPDVEWLDGWIQVSDETVLLSVSDSARLLVRSGRQVTLQWDEDPGMGGDPGWLLYGLGLRVAALQRGIMSLHAATVELDGSVACIAGASGAGKSTTGMALRQRGHVLLADDVALLEVREDGVWATPCGPSASLHADAARALGLDLRFEGLLPSLSGRNKAALFLGIPPPAPRRLDAVVVLKLPEPQLDEQEFGEPRHAETATSVRWEEVHGSGRFRELIGHTLFEWLAPRILGHEAYFRLLARIAAHVPVAVIERPSSEWTLGQVVAAVEEGVQGLAMRAPGTMSAHEESLTR